MIRMTLAGFLGFWVASAADCDTLAKLSLPATSIQSARVISEGTLAPAGGAALRNLPPFCRVEGTIRPSPDSDIRFEVWLPLTAWNQKFQGIGNGGFAGAISYGGLADALRSGYASASTDTGHQGGGTDAGWALGHFEKVVDFGHRAIHEMTVQGKAVTKAFYGSAPRRSYFNSCSNGGRQALMEAQRYPDDYDGIIAGAPANAWIYLLTTAIKNLQATSGAAYIPATKLPALQAAALAACDLSDGVKDGVVENPGTCKFDPGVLLCKAGDTDTCLTEAQVGAARKLYEGLVDGKGRKLYPGYSPGGEADRGGWGPWITGPAPEKSLLYAFGMGFFRNIVFGDVAWDYQKFELDRDVKIAEDKVGAVLNSTNPDLSRFHARGGKLILYHGWCDAAIPAQNAIDYYESVRKKLGAKTADAFVRLYMAPGVQHCGDGNGPNNFGQGGVAKGDARTNISAALERWVEENKPPAEIVAAKYKGAEAASGVVRTRPLCPYPAVAKYKGTGSTDDEANFTCAAK